MGELDLTTALRSLEAAAEVADGARARRAAALADALAVIAERKACDPRSWSPQAAALVRSPGERAALAATG